jgi:predicted nucleotidyltransferase
MPKRLSDSVKVKYLDGDHVVTQLRQCAAGLKKTNPNVLRIILFGSLVHGDYGPRSDADLLIVLSEDKRRRIDRIPEFLRAFSDASVPVDVLPLTAAELQNEIDQKNLHIQRILNEGVEIG